MTIKTSRTYFISYFPLFVVLLLFVYVDANAQSEKRILKKARKYLDEEKFSSAQEQYQKLLNINPNKDVYHFEMGISYFVPLQERSKSLAYFENALKNSSEDTIPELYYYLARAYHYNGDYEKSMEAFKKFKPFIKRQSVAGRDLIKETDYFIDRSKNGELLLKNIHEDIAITNLGNSINSEFDEYAPVFNNNDHVLIFTSRRKTDNSKIAPDLKPYENIYVAKQQNNSWQIITDKKELVNYLPNDYHSKKHNAGVIYSSDGKRLYLYKEDKIWVSDFENNQWTELKQLEKTINSSIYNIPSISLSNDNKTLFFVAIRKDGFGGKDIYSATLNEQGEWDKVKNLGENINTLYDEDAPFLSNDGKTLYFSSRGHDGIGGFDIFKSELINGNWSTPINLGIPYNSPADDIFYIQTTEDEGYFASSRKNGWGDMDIYHYGPKPEETPSLLVTIKLIDNNNQPLSNTVVTLDNGTNITTDENGIFSTTKTYTESNLLSLKKDGFKEQSVTIPTAENAKKLDLSAAFYQTKISEKTYQILTVKNAENRLIISDTLLIEKDDLVANENTNTNNTNTNQNNTSTVKTTDKFKQTFNYKLTQINPTNKDFIALLNKALEIANAGKTVEITIEASASNVPVTTFSNNQLLAKSRLEEAKKLLSNQLIAKGIKATSFKFIDEKSLVQGPDFENDASDINKYKPYQYIFIQIK